jgi:hypothetical protein
MLLGSDQKFVRLGKFVDKFDCQRLFWVENFALLKRYFRMSLTNRVEHGVSEPKRSLDAL